MMTLYTSVFGDVGIPYNDALWHPCSALTKGGTVCRALVRNGQHEHCRWHRPAGLHRRRDDARSIADWLTVQGGSPGGVE